MKSVRVVIGLFAGEEDSEYTERHAVFGGEKDGVILIS
jgi:hypothetical protein